MKLYTVTATDSAGVERVVARVPFRWLAELIFAALAWWHA